MILVLSVLHMCSCKSSKPVFNPDDTKKDFLIFGNGGGFTGQVTKYYLTKDGDVYQQSGDTTELRGTVIKSVSAQIFTNFNSLGLNQLSINEPGNRYFFVELKEGNSKVSLTWGKEPLGNKNLEIFYKVLMNSVKSLNQE